MKEEKFEKEINSILNNKKNNKKVLSKSELSELEKLAKTFGEKFKIIKIEGISVYGYNNYPIKYLGTVDEYYRYKLLNKKKKLQKNLYKK